MDKEATIIKVIASLIETDEGPSVEYHAILSDGRIIYTGSVRPNLGWQASLYREVVS